MPNIEVTITIKVGEELSVTETSTAHSGNPRFHTAQAMEAISAITDSLLPLLELKYGKPGPRIVNSPPEVDLT